MNARGLVWLVPLAAVAAGVLLVALRLRRAPPAVVPPSPEQLGLLRERVRSGEAYE